MDRTDSVSYCNTRRRPLFQRHIHDGFASKSVPVTSRVSTTARISRLVLDSLCREAILDLITSLNDWITI